MSTHRKLARSAGIIGILTAVSRVLGFIRDLIIATFFGTSAAAEAFVVSFKLPNLLRDLVGEGATNAAFVPVLTECRQKRPQDFWRLVSTLVLIMTMVLIVLSLLGIIFAPQVVRWIAPGFVDSSDPNKFPLTVSLTRVIFPYILFIGLSALAMGILNSLKEFTSSALGPSLLNLSMIAAGIFFEKTYGPMALVAGVLVGGFLQLNCQIPPLYKAGFSFHKADFKDPALKKIGKLLIPRALGSALYQINVFVDSILASFESIVGAGGQSALYYSNRLFQLPLAILGISLAQAVLPTFSTQIASNDLRSFRRTIGLSLRILSIAALPASIGLMIFAEPIVRIIFERGKFDAYSTHITSSALFYYSFGLIACCFIKILVNAFYALQDTKTPVRTTLFAVLLNLGLSLILMRHLKIGGLTLASSIAATVNVVFLYVLLTRKIGKIAEMRDKVFFLKLFFIALIMAGFCLCYNFFILEPKSGASQGTQIILLTLGIISAAGIYLSMLFILKFQEIRKIISWAR